jgi:hypothetical protein
VICELPVMVSVEAAEAVSALPGSTQDHLLLTSSTFGRGLG